MLIEILQYLALGAIVGTLAGLLGVGGGLVIVPALVTLFIAKGFSNDIIMHLALGTSLASILTTSIASAYSHHKKKAVNWPAAIRLTPGILLGAAIGGVFATTLSNNTLKPVFAIFECLVALYMLTEIKPRSHNTAPGIGAFSSGGGIIGFISALVGIGGGTMSVPWLMWYGNSIHRAIATSAALGFPIALASSFSYIISGWQHPQLPAMSLGFVYLPALFGIIASSFLFAPLGAKWAHTLPVNKLKRIFALLLLLLAIHLFFN